MEPGVPDKGCDKPQPNHVRKETEYVRNYIDSRAVHVGGSRNFFRRDARGWAEDRCAAGGNGIRDVPVDGVFAICVVRMCSTGCYIRRRKWKY